jgi:hypothetical protein
MKIKKPRFDIRRPVTLKKPVTGNMIAEALKKAALELQSRFVEMDRKNINGEESAMLGLSGSAPDADTVIRTGEDLSETRIFFNRTYETIGVGSIHWSGVKFNWDTYECGHIRNVELVKKELEEIF